MSPASASDVAGRWRPLSDAEQAVAEIRLEDAWRELRRLVPNLESRVEVDEDVRANAQQVLADAVIAVLQATAREGVRRSTVTIDDGTHTWEVDESAARTRIVFSADDLAKFAASTGFSGGFFSVMPS